MASRIDIINMALSNLGHDTKQDEDDNGMELNILRIHYDTARNECLDLHDWGFASRVRALAPLAWEADGEDRPFAYPTDAIKVYTVRDAGGTMVPFHIGRSGDNSRKALYAPADPPVTARYTSMDVSEADYPAPFVSMLTWRLAAAIAIGLHHDPQAADAAKRTFAEELRIAVNSDAREAWRGRMPDGDFILSRRS